MCKLHLAWMDYTHPMAVGNTLGYKTHNDTLKKYVSKIAIIDQEADHVLSITSPDYFQPQPNKINWLFTMFEGLDVPKVMLDNIEKADYIIVPSNWVKKLFCKYFDERIIFVVNHGVEKDFEYKTRYEPKAPRPFVYLWVGAPNPRKGTEEIAVVWEHGGFKDDPSCLLYMKTTLGEKLQRKGNVIFDSRKLSKKLLIQLYHNAHCFVMPHHGEGFGLTPLEAMSTGLPTIATYYSGITDYFNEDVGYPIGYRLKEHEIISHKNKKKYKSVVAFPEVEELVAQMYNIRLYYNKALEKGKLASKRVRKEFTWEKAAERIVKIIQSKS